MNEELTEIPINHSAWNVCFDEAANQFRFAEKNPSSTEIVIQLPEPNQGSVHIPMSHKFRVDAELINELCRWLNRDSG